MGIKFLMKKQDELDKIFAERKKLLKPLVKNYGHPVLVHAVDKESIFIKILNEGKLKLPQEHNSGKRNPFMEKNLGIDNGIYYSLGFVYATSYNWKYNFMFSADYLKDLIYYSYSINYECYKAIVDYWYENDREYLEKLGNTNKKCREVVDRYYYKTHHLKKRLFFDFWKIEPEVFRFFQEYKYKKELDSKIKEIEEKRNLKFPESLNDSKHFNFKKRSPEVIGLKENNLLTNRYFIGFYIRGSVTKEILKILKEKYSNKILYDSKSVRRISEL